MNYCLCCSNTLLRHIRGGSIYWFCSTCRQEMPNTYARSGATFSTRMQLESLLHKSVSDNRPESVPEKQGLIPLNASTHQS